MKRKIVEIKKHRHGFGRLLFDILRDSNSLKYSMTKFGALIGLLLLMATVIMSLMIMWMNKIIDHVLFLELIAFVLTLMGFKNNFGFKTNNSVVNNSTDNIDPSTDDKNSEKAEDKISDKTDDSLKG